MSHEIRTPMNGILGFTNLLKQPNISTEMQYKYIRIIEKSGGRMLNTIGDIIDISRIESNQVEITNSDIDLNKQMYELYEFFLPQAEKKNIKLLISNKLPNNETSIISDKDKIDSILTNLFRNSIKFTNSGSIEFGYFIVKQGKQSMLEFYIMDTGIGIPTERQKAIFNRFEQSDIEDKNVYEGSGLGLAISKAYVEMLGGRIWVESNDGEGSKFSFTIPCIVKEIESHKDNNLNFMNQQPDKKKLKILIVDDEEFVITFLEIVLKDFNRELLIAKTGAEAVEICRNNPNIDLVLMDIKMSVMDGYEATRKIRKFNKDVFIIAQTAFGLTGDREKSIEAGCDDYITKPIDRERLIEIISRQF